MKKDEIKLTKEEKRMLCNAILSEIQGFNSYKYNKFVNTEKIEQYQEKLQELLNKLAV